MLQILSSYFQMSTFSGGHNFLAKIERRQTQRQTYAERLDENGVLVVL